MNTKLIGYLGITIVVLNLILFVFRVIDWLTFLIILGLSYFGVKYGLPKINKVNK